MKNCAKIVCYTFCDVEESEPTYPARNINTIKADQVNRYRCHRHCCIQCLELMHGGRDCLSLENVDIITSNI